MQLIDDIKAALIHKLDGEGEIIKQISILFETEISCIDFNKVFDLCQTLFSSEEFPLLFKNKIKTPTDLSIFHCFIEMLSKNGQRQEAINLLETLSHEPHFISPLFLRRLLFQVGMTDEEKEKLKKLFCLEPFTTFRIWPNGDVSSCCRLPYIGNIHQNTLAEIWDSPKAKEIRQNILDGNFKACNLYDCDIYRRGILPQREDINISDYQTNQPPKIGHWGGSNSCALSCFWCRKEVIYDREETHLYAMKDELFEYYNQCETIYSSPAAEFSDSIFTLDLINRLGSTTPSGKTRLWGFSTNGISFTPEVWRYIEKSCKKVRLTITGRNLTPEAFALVSPQSHLEQWLKNIDFYLQKKAERIIIFVRLKVILSNLNYKEIPLFVDWVKEKGIDEVVFRRLHQWGTIDKEEMDELDVCHPNHPNNAELREIISKIPPSPQVIFRDLIV